MAIRMPLYKDFYLNRHTKKDGTMLFLVEITPSLELLIIVIFPWKKKSKNWHIKKELKFLF